MDRKCIQNIDYLTKKVVKIHVLSANVRLITLFELANYIKIKILQMILIVIGK